jgi:hypothetical protein
MWLRDSALIPESFTFVQIRPDKMTYLYQKSNFIAIFIWFLGYGGIKDGGASCFQDFRRLIQENVFEIRNERYLSIMEGKIKETL